MTSIANNSYQRPTSPAPSSQEISNAAADLLEGELRERDALQSPEAVRGYLKARLRHYAHEVFAALLLDNRHRVIGYRELFRGTIDGASVHAREVVREAIDANAAAVIFAHNHPSGVAEPSQADVQITNRLKNALALIDVRVLDHFVVGDGAGTSFAERGLI
jgi:DNA repair protein RadC